MTEFTSLVGFVTNFDSLICIKMAEVVLGSGWGLQRRERDE